MAFRPKTWSHTARSLLRRLVSYVRPTPGKPLPDVGRVAEGLDVPDAPPAWEYVPEGWARKDPRLTDWNVEGVVAAYEAKISGFLAALHGPEPLGMDTEARLLSTDPHITGQSHILAFAYSLLLASRRSDSVSILDWGGGVGLFFALSRVLLPREVAIEYHVKEMPLVCDLGRTAFPEVHFHDDDSCLDRQYDLVFASGALQMSEDWKVLLHGLANASRRFLFLTRVPVVFQAPSFVAIQRVPDYQLEYKGWVLNREELVDQSRRAGLEFVREFLLGHTAEIHGAPENFETRAFLFAAASGDRPSS